MAVRSLNQPDIQHRDPRWLAEQARTHPVALYLVDLAPPAHQAVVECLHAAARELGAADAWSCDWAALTIQDAQVLRLRLAERYGLETAHRQLLYLRGVYCACMRLGWFDIDAYRQFRTTTERSEPTTEPATVDGGKRTRTYRRRADRHLDPDRLAQMADTDPVALHLIDLAPSTRRNRLCLLDAAARAAGAADAWSCDWAALTAADIEALIVRLAERYARSTVGLQTTALRRVFRACWRLGLIDADAHEQYRATTLRIEPATVDGGVRTRTYRRPASQSMRDSEWLRAQARTDPVALYLVDLAPSTRRTTLHLLTIAARELGAADAWSCDWSALTADDIQALEARLGQRHTHSMVNQLICCLRRVFRACWRLGLVETDAHRRQYDAVGPLRNLRDPYWRDPYWLAQMADTHPVALYLSLRSDRSRQSVLRELNVAARALGAADAWNCNWAALTVENVDHLTNTTLPFWILRGMFSACRRLGLVDDDTHRRHYEAAGGRPGRHRPVHAQPQQPVS